jgi:hypothetical protein
MGTAFDLAFRPSRLEREAGVVLQVVPGKLAGALAFQFDVDIVAHGGGQRAWRPSPRR